MIDLTSNKLTWRQRAKWKDLIKESPMNAFIPNGAQAQLIKAIGTMVPDKRIFLATSGNGSGKTTLAINIIANLVFKNLNMYRDITDLETGEHYTGFFDYPIFNHWPKGWPKAIWYISNNESLKSIWKEFKIWIPARHYKASKDGKTHISSVEFPGTDWTLNFRTVDQDPDTFESANVGCIICDEPPPWPIFHAAISRARSGSFFFIPATPLFKAAWMKDEIADQAEPESDKFHQRVSVWENCVERAGLWRIAKFGLQKKGNLEEKNIQFTLNNYDPDEREAREHGIFMFLSGLVYKTYDQKKHMVAAPKNVIPRHYDYAFVLDPHDRRPPSAIWARMDKWGRLQVFRNWPSRNEDKLYRGMPFHKIKSADPYIVKDFVKEWVKIFRYYKIPNEKCLYIIDPNFGNKPDRTTGKLLYQIYQEEFDSQGWPIGFITNVVDDIEAGHAAVKGLLKAGPDGDLKFTITDNCLEVDWSMRNYCFDDYEGKAVDKHNLKETVKEIGKDFADCVRYLAMSPLNYTENPEKEEPDEDYGETEEATNWRSKIPPRPKGAQGA